MVYPEVSLFIYFFLRDFLRKFGTDISLKFGHNAWIGPEGNNKDFRRDSFCSFLIKEKNAVIWMWDWVLLASAGMGT